MNPSICPICRNATHSPLTGNANNGTKNVDCQQCGNYTISDEAGEDADGILTENRALASAWLVHNRPAVFDQTHLELVRNGVARPSLTLRALSLLRWLGNKYPAGTRVSVGEIQTTGGVGANPLLPQSWSLNLAEAMFMFYKVLIEELQYVSQLDINHVQISPKGWIALEGRPNSESSVAFVAMWFSEEVQALFVSVIDPAIRDAGFEPLRIDGKEHNNKIDDEIVASIRSARFVVADYTGERGGVYYEAGFAHGLGLPVVFMAKEGTPIHFDTRQYNTIFWKEEDFEDARERLKNRILATLGRGPKASN